MRSGLDGTTARPLTSTRPAVGGVSAEHGLGDLGPAGADQPGHADDLAGPEREGDVGEAAGEAEALDPQHLLALGRGPAAGEQRLDAAPDHQADDAGPVERPRRPRRHVPPVAQHGDVVGDGLDLLQAMGDQEDRLAGGAQRANDGEQLLGLGRGQRRGRLVEDQQLDVGGERAGDLDEL